MASLLIYPMVEGELGISTKNSFLGRFDEVTANLTPTIIEENGLRVGDNLLLTDSANVTTFNSITAGFFLEQYVTGNSANEDNFYTSTFAANIYTLQAGDGVNPPAYYDGLAFLFVADATSTGNVSIQIGALAVTVFRDGGLQIGAGEILIGDTVEGKFANSVFNVTKITNKIVHTTSRVDVRDVTDPTMLHTIYQTQGATNAPSVLNIVTTDDKRVFNIDLTPTTVNLPDATTVAEDFSVTLTIFPKDAIITLNAFAAQTFRRDGEDLATVTLGSANTMIFIKKRVGSSDFVISGAPATVETPWASSALVIGSDGATPPTFATVNTNDVRYRRVGDILHVHISYDQQNTVGAAPGVGNYILDLSTILTLLNIEIDLVAAPTWLFPAGPLAAPTGGALGFGQITDGTTAGVYVMGPFLATSCYLAAALNTGGFVLTSPGFFSWSAAALNLMLNAEIPIKNL